MSLDDDLRQKLAQAVAADGEAVADPEAAKVQTNATGGIQIQAENLTLSHVTLTAGGEVQPIQVPKVKPVQEMDQDERSAFQSGRWDGIDRRLHDENSKIYKKALSKEKRRARDLSIVLVHKGILLLLFLILVGSLIVAYSWSSAT